MSIVNERSHDPCVPDVLSALEVLGVQVVVGLGLGVGRGVGEPLQLLHVSRGLHLDQILPHGDQLVHLVTIIIIIQISRVS